MATSPALSAGEETGGDWWRLERAGCLAHSLLRDCTVSSCTYNEAKRYGLFLNVTLGMVDKWHSSSAVFDKECAPSQSEREAAGCVLLLLQGPMARPRCCCPGFLQRAKGSDRASVISYDAYRNLCYKWHCRLTKVRVHSAAAARPLPAALVRDAVVQQAFIFLLEADDADVVLRSIVVLTQVTELKCMMTSLLPASNTVPACSCSRTFRAWSISPTSSGSASTSSWKTPPQRWGMPHPPCPSDKQHVSRPLLTTFLPPWSAQL